LEKRRETKKEKKRKKKKRNFKAGEPIQNPNAQKDN